MELSFKNKYVLLSGAAGYVGVATALSFARANAECIYLLDLPEREDDLQELAAQCRAEGCKAEILTGDISQVPTCSSLVRQIQASGGTVDILANIAGRNAFVKALELTEDIWDFVVDANLKAAFFLTQQIGESFILQRQGVVLFVGSQHGVVGNIDRSHYCASKSGLLGLMRALTAEWSKFHVRVNTVSPTWILNDVNEDYLMDSIQKRSMLQKIPLHRYATAQDVANALLFLASDYASMITGQNLVIDGGYTVL